MQCGKWQQSTVLTLSISSLKPVAGAEDQAVASERFPSVQRRLCGAPRHPRSLPPRPNPCFQRLRRCLASPDTSLVPSIRKGDTSTLAATHPEAKQKIPGLIRYSSFHKHSAIKAAIAAIISDAMAI